MKNILSSLIAYLIITNGYTQTSLSYRITPWQDNKKAAVVLTYDDNYAAQFNYGISELNSRGMRATFFIMTNSINWADANIAVNAGHEIASHGTIDEDLTDKYPSDITYIENVLQQSKDSIEANIDNYSCRTIAWPSGGGGGSSEADSAVRHLAYNYYYAARNAGGEIAPYDKYLNPWFDNFWFQYDGVNDDGATANNFGSNIRSAINKKGYYVSFMHDLPSQSAYAEILDTIKNYENDIWIAPFVEVNFYHHEVVADADLSIVSENTDKWELNLTDTLTPDSIFNIPLTFRLAKPAWDFDSITQNGESLDYTLETDTIQFNAIPDGGNIVFHKSGATDVNNKSMTETNNAIIVKPNPIINQAIISFYASGDNTTIDLFDVTGNKIKTLYTGNPGKDKTNIFFNGDQYTSGVYFIQINNCLTKKIIIQ